MVNSSSIPFEENTVDVAVSSTLMGRRKGWASWSSLCSQGAFPRQKIRVGGRGFPFSCVIGSMQATCFSLKYFFQAAKSGVFLSGTDHKLEVFVYIFFL